MARFFIDRPIFAWVVAIIVSIAGVLSILRLPISQYPAVAPPTIQIQATYPGASAKTLEDTVTQIIEQRMNGLDGLRFLSSGSDATGGVSIELVFEPGTNPDIAQVQVQNKLSLAMPQLPQEVQRQGIRVAKSNRNFLVIAAFVSRDGSMSRNDISDYIFSTLQDPISRVRGVGDVQVFGAQYAMRIWLDPEKLSSYKLTPLDVRDAILAQNAQVSVGEFGGAPAVKGQALNATITAQSRLSTPEEFGAILMRVNSDGSQVRLRDVSRIELTGENFATESFCNASPCSGLAVRLAAGANALATADAVRARFAELAPTFPPALEVTYPIDNAPFVRISIEEVVKTLLEAIGLVFLVMLLFLQNIRATLIPTLAVPVVLLGTFGVLSAFGYSINTLTLFGTVLAIGLLVDDAIVVVENVERVMHDEGLSPKEATRKSMHQITGALVGIALVLSAVFIPMAFFGGSVGVIYKQFSITIVSAMTLSVLVALSFTPALCASILKKPKEGPRRGFYGLFNRGYAATNRGYARAVGGIVRRRWYAMIAFVAIGGALALLFPRMPKGFLPDEDQGVLNAQVLLPPGATQEQTRAVMDKVQSYFLNDEKEAVDQVMAITGFGYGGRGQNTGLAFIRLRHWDERTSERLKAKAVAARAMRAFSQIKEANAFTFAPPAIAEALGTVGGFSFQLEDRAGLGHDALIAARDQLLGLAAKHPKLARVRPAGLEDRPEYKIDVDREKASALGLSLADINNTLSMTWGGSYVNDFIDDGRTKRVYLQADAQFRMSPRDLDRWYVRNRAGEMVPFSAFASGKWTFGSPKLDRFNGFPTIQLNGEAGPGAKPGEAMQAMEELSTQLPQGIGYEWSGMSYDEKSSGANAPILYALSLLVVFLCLAALYESWTIPVSVMLVVPLGVIGAVGATILGNHANDVYFQVGLLATIGLSAKNAILIVEFAKDLVAQGRTPAEASIEAARMRLRPIIMTSLAFILGVLPLALANGAGAGAQNAIGLAVIGGVVAATVLGVLFVPVFFTVISRRPRPPAIAAALIALCSCSLAPKYERPVAPVANQWEVASQQSASELGWRDVMRDPRLQAVVEFALKNNRDLRVAALNVELVRAQYRIERASLYPTLSGIASAEVAGNKDDAQATYTLGGSLSYELDLFGKLRSARTAAYEEYLGSAEAARAAHIALVGEVATQFLVAQAFDEQLALARQTLGLVQESADVTKRLAEQGQRSDLDLRTAEAQIHTARAEVARVTRLRAQANNALLLLTGAPAFPQLPAATPLETTNILADLPPGVPSQVLLRRPDVLAAEHALKSANANIGVARAAFFPSISLTAFGGLASTALSSLFTAGAFAWSAGGTLAQPLFTGGKLSATLEVAHVRKQIEVARYELAIQTAFREVADALAAKAALDEQLAAQLARVEAEQKRFAISEQRYKAGIESYIVMITAQRDLFAAQQGLIDVRLSRATNLVELYRALGGGWR